MKIAGMIVGACAALALGMGAGFAAKKAAPSTDGKLKVVATIFPEYDWTREILGGTAGDVELSLLLDNGVDLHSYQPSFKDIAKIVESDIFIYVGGESDEWVDDVLRNAKNPKMKVINLLETLGDKVKEEEFVEEMQAEEEEGDDDAEETEYDEHVWLSLRNAQIFCEKIADALCEADAKNASVYRANLALYCKKLSDLDAQYSAAVQSAKSKTLLFGDRFPFRYLVDDYGLNYYAAFLGCSAESEASFKTIAFLSEKVNALNLQSVCQIETGRGKIARTIIANSKNKNASVVTFVSLQSTTTKQIKAGATYLGAMESNLSALVSALN